MTPTDPLDPTNAGAAAAARRRMLVISIVGGVLAAALLVAIIGRAASNNGTVKVKSATSLAGEFTVGSARQLAASVDTSGPFLFPDPQGHSRDIFVQHLGGDTWVAFEARVAGAPRNCVLHWAQDAHHFVDPCDGHIYPADGTGLVSFPTRVDAKGRVVVDLSQPIAPTITTTTVAPAPTTTTVALAPTTSTAPPP